jgi:hypothetical protein
MRAAEYVPHADEGVDFALDAMERICFSDDEKKAARLLFQGHKAMAETADGLGLKYGSQTVGLERRYRAIDKQIRGYQSQADLLAAKGGYQAADISKVPITERAILRLSTKGEEISEEVAQAVVESQKVKAVAAKAAKAAPSVPPPKRLVAEQQFEKFMKGYRTAAPPGQQIQARRAAEIAEAGEAGAARAAKMGVKGELPVAGFAVEEMRKIQPGQMPARPDIPFEDPSAGRLPLVPKAAKGVKATAYSKAKAAQKLSTLDEVMTKMHGMEERELQRWLQGTLTPKEYSNIKDVYARLQRIRNARAVLQRRVRGLDTEGIEKALSAAQKVDAERARIPGYIPRSPAKELKKPLALLEKETIHRPAPLTRGSMAKERVWRTRTGRPLYREELSARFREATDIQGFEQYKGEYSKLQKELESVKKTHAGKQIVGESKKRVAAMQEQIAEMRWNIGMTENMHTKLRNLYGTDSIEDAAALAKEDIASGIDVTSMVFEADPERVAANAIGNYVRDAEVEGTIQGLRVVSSDRYDAAHTVRSSMLGAEVHNRFPDKWFPKEIAQEYHQWKTAMLREADDPARWVRATAGAFDSAQGLWKLEKTALWPAFHVRNIGDDIMRSLTVGARNPVATIADGTRTAWSAGTINLGEQGAKAFGSAKVSAKDFRTICNAYGVFGTMAQEMTGPAGRTLDSALNYVGAEGVVGRAARGAAKGLGRTVSFSEEVVRAGTFAQLIRNGMAPIDAAAATNKALFDYSNLAAWEKGLAKRLIPWWTFRTRNLAFQFEKLFTHPYWTSAQMRLLRHRKLKQKDKPEEREDISVALPSRLRGNIAPIVEERGVTKRLWGIGLGVTDLVEILDSAGHPKGPFRALGEKAWNELSPAGRAGAELVQMEIQGTGGILMKAPKGSEQLPETVKEWLGIREEVKMVEGMPITEWFVPKRSAIFMRNTRAISEMLKRARVEETKKLSRRKLQQWVATLSGFRLENLDSLDVEIMIVKERVDSLNDALNSKGQMLEGGRPTLEGKNSAIGAEYKFYKDHLINLYQMRRLQDYGERLEVEQLHKKEQRRGPSVP